MSSTYSTNLAIELIGTGDQAGSWGNTTNTNLGTLVEQAISGYVTQAVSTGTDTTITIPNGATGVARNMYIELTGTGGASTNLIVPANKKLYFIFNNTSSGQVTVKVSGQTGVSVPNKAKMILVSDGTDIVDATNYIGNISAASANITVLTSASATITNLIATSASITTLTNNPTFGAGTANGVLYLNGSKVATSGSALVFDGTNLGVNCTATALTNYRGSEFAGTTATTGGFLRMRTSDSSINSLDFTDSNGRAIFTTTNHPIRFGTNDVERMRLTSSVLSTDSSINVGIGTASPSTYSVAPNLVVSTATNGGMTIRTGSSNYGAVFFADGTTGDEQYRGGIQYNHDYLGSTDTLLLVTAGTTKARIDSSGNLGLGVTPSAWASNSWKAIEANYGESLVFDLNNINTLIVTNAYNDGSWKYKGTAAAAYYQVGTGTHTWYNAASGTAGNTISFTQAMTLDASGNLGVGTTSPGSFSGTVKLVVGSAATTTTPGAVTVYSGNATYGGLYFADGTVGDQLYRGAVEYNHSTDALLFYSSGTERARIDSSGNLLLGGTSTAQLDGAFGQLIGSSSKTTAAIALETQYGAYMMYTDSTDSLIFWDSGDNAPRARIDSSGNFLVGTTATGLQTVRSMGFQVNAGCTQFISHSTADGSGDSYVEFGYNGTKIGSITQNGTTAVAYNTTSDYRLKTFISPVTGAGARLDALKPVEYEWKADGKLARGFFAHEFQQVYADSVTGEKDAVDAAGKPVYQAMQASTTEVIADLVAEIQSLRSRVAALEAK